MTTVILCDKLLEQGEKMRNAQKGYFKEKDPAKKKQFLIASKQAEQEFDTLIINGKTLIGK